MAFATLFLACLLTCLDAVSSETPGPTPQRTSLSAAFLLGDGALTSPVATSAFARPPGASSQVQAFSGLLSLDMNDSPNQIRVLVDRYGVVGEQGWKLATLPSFSFQFVGDGHALISVQRVPQRSDHPYWEVIPAPGKRWVEKADGGWTRAALPFALKEKNQNCIHNGLMTFLYQADGRVSRVAWQITSETCQYLKIDMWGVSAGDYEPRPVKDSEELIASYRREVSRRLPVQPLQRLAEVYPGVNPAVLVNAQTADTSAYGFVIDGTHYRNTCPTRYGPYPFCDQLILPSYSLAKSVFGGLGYLLLTRRWPEFAEQSVTDLVPECDVEDRRWQGVTTRNLVNMKTGLYDSSDFNHDEDDEKMQAFFIAESHADKLRFSCQAWSKKSDPGKIAVYHTTDTYLLGVAMNRFLKSKAGPQADIHSYLYERLFKPLGLSPLAQWTQRTDDPVAQPFTGFGLIFLAEDIAKIAAHLADDASRDQNLPGPEVEATMFRGAGVTVDFTSGRTPYAYRNGVWGIDFGRPLGCRAATWIPFMSGYGGIVVAMFPNDSVYYQFTDGGHSSFKNVAIEANKAINYCQES